MNKGCFYVTNSTPRYLGQKVTSDSLEKKLELELYSISIWQPIPPQLSMILR